MTSHLHASLFPALRHDDLVPIRIGATDPDAGIVGLCREVAAGRSELKTLRPLEVERREEDRSLPYVGLERLGFPFRLRRHRLEEGIERGEFFKRLILLQRRPGEKAEDVDEAEIGGASGDVDIEFDDDRVTQRNPAQRETERR